MSLERVDTVRQLLHQRRRGLLGKPAPHDHRGRFDGRIGPLRNRPLLFHGAPPQLGQERRLGVLGPEDPAQDPSGRLRVALVQRFQQDRP